MTTTATNVTMTPNQFKRWQKRMGWSVSQTARELRLKQRQVYCYRSGTSLIPPMAERLCEVLEERHEITTRLGRRS